MILSPHSPPSVDKAHSHAIAPLQGGNGGGKARCTGHSRERDRHITEVDGDMSF